MKRWTIWSWTVAILPILALVLLAFVGSVLAATSFPVIENASGAGSTAGGTSLIVNLPTGGGGIVAGDLLIVFICQGDVSLPILPSGWTSIATGSGSGSGGAIGCRAMDRIAIGGETAVTVTFAVDNAIRFYQAVRIVGHSGLATGASSQASEQDQTNPPNPPNFDTTEGVKTNLWLAVGAYGENQVTATVWNITGAPTSYTFIRQTDGTFPTAPDRDNGIRSAYRFREVEAENPGAFSMTSSAGTDMNWVAFTVAVQPQDTPPLVTLPAIGIGSDRATMRGRLDVLFSSLATVRFEYGITIDLGNDSSDLTRTTTGTFQILVTGLAPDTTYFFRAFSEEVPSGYTARGEILNFTTLPTNESLNLAVNFVWILAFIMLMILIVMGAWVLRERLG